MKALIFAALAATAQGSQSDYAYNVELIRAAPGHLLELIDVLHQRSDAYSGAAGDERPFILRHSQGDQWDLMVVQPVGRLSEFFDAGRMAARRTAAGELSGGASSFAVRFQQLVSWREETFFVGPPVGDVRGAFDEAGFFHIEMFVALPGKGEELHRERLMENEYLERLGRAPNLVFDKILGGSWDMMTIGLYRDLMHYAQSGDLPEAREEEAARAAGFEAASRIGTYLRELISSHHDTLATAVRAEQ